MATRNLSDWRQILKRGRVPSPLGGLRGDIGILFWNDMLDSLTQAGSDIPGLILATAGAVINDSAHVVRTTSLATTTAFVDVDLDNTDIETDANVIAHGAPDPTDRITLKVAGTYLCALHASATAPTVANSNALIQIRIRLNDTTVLPGSEIEVPVFQDNQITGNTVDGHAAATFVFQATANDFITLQVQHTIIGGSPDPALKANLVGVSVVRLL